MVKRLENTIDKVRKDVDVALGALESEMKQYSILIFVRNLIRKLSPLRQTKDLIELCVDDNQDGFKKLQMDFPLLNKKKLLETSALPQ